MGISEPPVSNEPLARGIILHTFREAAIQTWGEASLLKIAEQLPDDARVATFDVIPAVLEWQPERYAMAWYEAAWAGPCRGDERAFAAFVDKSVDLSFGRVRRAMLAFITPVGLLHKASELWRHDHTHGTLAGELHETLPRQATCVLRDHPYVATNAPRRAAAEAFRHIVSLARVKNVRETHSVEGRALTVRLVWD